MRRAVLTGAFLCAVALACVEVRATTAIQLTPDEQVADARAICLGRCTRIETRDVGGRIFTYITLDVREVLKGDATTGRLVVRQIGGQVGQRGEWIAGSPRFDVGRDSLVFLATSDDGCYVVDGLFMGNFSIESGADGREWIRRDTGGEGTRVLKRSGAPADDPLSFMALDDLRGIVGREAAKTRTDYGVTAHQVPPEYTRYFEGASEITPSFVLMDNTRWFEPDTNAAVPFYCNPENFDPQGATTPDLPAAVQDALNAWSTISGCSFRYQYMGIDTNGCGWGTPIDHVSRVSVDCHGEIAGSGCRSIIAIGGGHWTRSESVVVNGTTFYKIYEADVCLQDGWCDYFQNPVSLREVLTHELGHCLGLGHSLDHTATMAPFIHNDGRGATLMPDDMDGARFIYPGPDTGGGGGGGTDPDPPTIATTSLVDAIATESYAEPLGVTNGKAPFVWDLTSGTLPPGIALAPGGMLSGVPTVAGTYAFSVRVTDSLGRTDARFLSILVHAPPPSVLAAAFRSSRRQLTIVGTNFAVGAQFEINGLAVAPRKQPVFNASAGTYVIKGSRKQLHLNKGSGTNQLVVIVDGERSQPFVF